MLKRRIGYCKLGRSITMNPDKYGYQGDAEAPQLLARLAARNPDVEWVLVGKNDSTDEHPLAPNVTNVWHERQVGSAWGFSDKIGVLTGTLDGIVVQHGQTGTSHHAIPQSDSTWADYYRDPMRHATTPQDWGCAYAGFLIRGMNLMGDRTDGHAPVVWLVPDPRNYVKARDVKWPTGCDHILSQYTYDRTQRHERWRDPRLPSTFPHLADWNTPERDGEVWRAQHTYRSAGLELMILPDDWEMWGAPGFHDRLPAGIATTSFAVDPSEREPRRSQLVRDWLLESWPLADVTGKWDKGSLKDVPPNTVVETKPHEFAGLLNRWRTTLALPALGSSWTTAKPYQCWAGNVATFMVGRLDGQGFVLPTRRHESPATQVGEVNGRPYYSIRDDWTENDIILASWLRVETPEEFRKASHVVANDEGVWRWITAAQRNLLRSRWNAHLVESTIEERLGLR